MTPVNTSRRMGRLLTAGCLMLMMGACAPQKASLTAENDAQNNSGVQAENSASVASMPASRLVALSSLKVSVFNPASGSPTVADDDSSWFRSSSAAMSDDWEGLDPNAKGDISCGYGVTRRARGGRVHVHLGVDIRAPKGSPVMAFREGTVARADRHGAYGLCIEVKHADGSMTRYAHLSAMMVKAGQTVKAGTRIGSVGMTGRTTGAHLHFEVLRNGKNVNPMTVLSHTDLVVRPIRVASAEVTSVRAPSARATSVRATPARATSIKATPARATSAKATPARATSTRVASAARR